MAKDKRSLRSLQSKATTAGLKIGVGIIGTGNIGCDLLVKIQKSKYLKCAIFAGQSSKSAGIEFAKKMGVKTSADSIAAIVKNSDDVDIVFDATNADSHIRHSSILKKMGKFTIDMTPSQVGKMGIPVLNLEECLKAQNINMISCGGQDTTPLVSAIMDVHPETKYIEIVSHIASKSAGLGTRDNIDEYTQTTCDGIRAFAKVPKAKAIIILNPAEPPIIMHNTIYAQIAHPNIKLLKAKITSIVKRIKKYVPGYRLTLGPVWENDRVTVMNEVAGRGDFLPKYAGNLDIINCAAVAFAEEFAKRKLNVSRSNHLKNLAF